MFGLAGLVCAARADVKSVRVEGDKILVNDKPVKLWGLRVAGALESEETASELLGSLDQYKERDVNALVVCYQGSTGNVKKVFSPDGKSFADEPARQRMRKIIEAAAQRDMVVIVGLFFPRKMGLKSEDPKLALREAYIEAVRLAAGELKDAPNVILSIAHDAGKSNWMGCPIKFDDDDAVECLKAAAEVAPKLPRGCGGTERAFNAAVAKSEFASLLLHTEVVGDLPKYETTKPIVNLGLFGRNAGGRGPQGVWNDIEKEKFIKAMEAYLGSPQHHLVVHFQGWHEGGMDLKPNRFAIGGDGTAKDPGTAWFFDKLHAKLHPPVERRPVAGDKPEGPNKTIFD